jgi:hypothetical protein
MPNMTPGPRTCCTTCGSVALMAIVCLSGYLCSQRLQLLTEECPTFIFSLLLSGYAYQMPCLCIRLHLVDALFQATQTSQRLGGSSNSLKYVLGRRIDHSVSLVFQE